MRLCYLGRPDFITNELVAALRVECVHWRPEARLNGYQMISGVDTPHSRSVAEQLAASPAMIEWVSRHAGRCEPSFVTNYLYYDSEGHYCEPTLTTPLHLLRRCCACDMMDRFIRRARL